MIDNYFDSETYHRIDFSESKIQKGEYDNCTFTECNFSEVHASNIEFVECEFIDCNFSNAIVKDTAFKDVSFLNCKMIGVKFYEVDTFLLKMKFDNCQLSFSSFRKLKIHNTHFKNCQLEEVEFASTDLTGTIFANCNLKNAIFERTNLEKVDFRTATHLKMNPDENRLKGARFSKESALGLLNKYKIIIE